jgi:hypothetical protein
VRGRLSPRGQFVDLLEHFGVCNAGGTEAEGERGDGAVTQHLLTDAYQAAITEARDGRPEGPASPLL